MTFEKTIGPKVTGRSLAEVAAAVKEVGSTKRYMGMLRRHAVKETQFGVETGLSGFMHASHLYQAFKPTDDDDPFATGTTKVDFKVGWIFRGSLTNSMGMTLNNEWRVIFEVRDDVKTRAVTARISGTSGKKEVASFVDHVFKLL